MSRFQEFLIEAKTLGGKDVYVSSWLEAGLWKALVVEQGRVAGSVREFTGSSRSEAIAAAEADATK